jgi:DNA-binding transcriptional ArsR family regulator
MLRVHFTSEDLSRITIAADVDPLWEVLFSLHLLQEREHTLLFGEWRRRVRAARPARLPLLLELAPPTGYSPDFLTPGRGDADFPTLVDRMLSTPRHSLEDDLSFMARRRPATPWTRTLGTGDVAALRRLAGAVNSYYNTSLAPYRSQMHAQIQADRARRSQALLAGGVDRLLSNLHPQVTWQPPVLQVFNYEDHDIYLQGRGLVLLPSFFCRRRPITLRDTDLPPVLAYPVTMTVGWTSPGDAASRPLATLLGHSRVATLHACISESTTTELARRIGLSAPAASRQARVLRDAGLITTRRDGGTVLHQITGLGMALLNGQLAQ